MADRSRSVIGLGSADLLVSVGIGLWTIAIGVWDGNGMVSQVLGFPAIVFAPGYAVVAALFPRDHQSNIGAEGINRVSPGERVVLAVGLSVCIVPLVGIGLTFASALRSSSFLITVGALTIAATAIAVGRRLSVPEHERFNPRLFAGIRDASAALRASSWLTVVLVIGLVLAGAGIGVAALTTDSGEEFTEFYLTTADPGESDSVAGGYPNELTLDGTEQVRIGVTNREDKQMSYTVVVLLQSIDDEQVQAAQQLDRFSFTAPQGATVTRTHTIGGDSSGSLLSGENLRLVYLLYIDSPPSAAELGTDTAYRNVHIWVDIPDSA